MQLVAWVAVLAHYRSARRGVVTTQWLPVALPGGDAHGVPAKERFSATGRRITAPAGSRIQPRARGERPLPKGPTAIERLAAPAGRAESLPPRSFVTHRLI